MSALLAPVPDLRIRSETPADAAAVDRLVLEVFGPGRFAKSAERIREKAHLAAGYVAPGEMRLIGSVRLWAITVDGLEALFLGPIAVASETRDQGIGADLVKVCLEHARAMDVAGVLLVGDPPYFSRFGFQAAPKVMLPGPADARRVLWLGLTAPVVQGPAVPA